MGQQELSARWDRIEPAIEPTGSHDWTTLVDIVLWAGPDLESSKARRRQHTASGDPRAAKQAALAARSDDQQGLRLVPAGTVLVERKTTERLQQGVAKQYTALHGGRMYFQFAEFEAIASEDAKELPGFQAPRLPKAVVTRSRLEVAPF